MGIMASFFSDPTMSRRMSEGNGDLRRRSSAGVAREAYVTMVTTDDYVQGAMVLAHSLRETGNASGRDVVCMVTNNLSLLSIELLGKAGMKVVVVDPINRSQSASSSCPRLAHPVGQAAAPFCSASTAQSQATT